MMQLTATALLGVPLVQPGDDVAALLLHGLTAAGITLAHGDVLVVTSKVVAKAENRFRHLRDVHASPAAREIAAACHKDPRLVELILAESREVLRVQPGVIVVEHRLGFVCANAGIDHSNTDPDTDVVLLLPADPDHSARALRAALHRATDADVAVIINDSHGRAWRMGTVGVAIGVAGLLPLSDERGHEDLFGHPLRITVLATADELAATASLLQGAAAEGTPFVHLRGAPYQPGDASLSTLLRPRTQDLFR